MDLKDEIWLRLAAFLAVFVVLAVAEGLLPRRALTLSRLQRWATNLGIVAIDSLLVRAMAALSVPLVAVAAATYASAHGIGLLNWIGMPGWAEVLIAIVVLDFAIWAQHVASHKVALFWRLHQMHHADRDIDVTTALRFHPLEIALSMLWKIAVVMGLGASAASVLAFEVILNACAMFSHANIRLPDRLDRVVRLGLVTPDMHRMHHSTIPHEHDSNYGFNLSVWDRIFGTYRIEPEKGHVNMEIGLKSYRTEAPARLLWCLALPFRGGRNRPREPRQKRA